MSRMRPAFMLGAVALVAAGTALAEPANGRFDMKVTIRDRGQPGEAEGLVRGVMLEGEAAGEEAALAYGFRSMRSTVDVDCVRGRERVVRMEAYEQHERRGAASPRRVTGQWTQPSPDAYLAEVVSAICRGRSVREPARQLAANTAPPPSAAASPPPPAPPPAPPPPVLRRAPTAPAVPVLARNDPPRVPAETAPLATARDERAPAPPQPQPKPAAAIARTDPPKPAVKPPTPTPAKAAPMPMAALAIVAGPAQPPRPAAPSLGAFVAQVAAASSPEGARQALNGIGALLGKGQSARVEPATVDGRQVYRATVAGFVTRAEANAFCAKVERSGGSCWAR